MYVLRERIDESKPRSSLSEFYKRAASSPSFRHESGKNTDGKKAPWGNRRREFEKGEAQSEEFAKRPKGRAFGDEQTAAHRQGDNVGLLNFSATVPTVVQKATDGIKSQVGLFFCLLQKVRT